MNQFAVFVRWSALAGLALTFVGCFGAPEKCKGCLAALADGGGVPEVPEPDLPMATGGATGSGGIIGTGGMSTGGMGTGGAATGGMATGGAATGGRATGGANTGGAAGTGGMATGGAASGGMGTGGRASGGAGGMNTGGAGGNGGATTDPDLVLWYKFDNNANDSAMYGGMARNATLGMMGTGTAAYSTTHKVGTHSLNLTSSSSTVGGFATVPANLQMQLPGAVSISLWVNVRSNQAWQRVFDFGTTATTPLIYMFLTTNQNASTPNSVRFAISTNGNGANDEQAINQTTPATLSLNAWHHIVIVLPAGATYTGTMYIDGAVAGTNNAMTLHPTSVTMANSYIGRSQWTNDPLFNGYVDDFRIYRRALTAAEVTTLFNAQ